MMEWLADYYDVKLSEVKEWPMHVLDQRLDNALYELRHRHVNHQEILRITGSNQMRRHFGSPYDGLKKR